MSVIHYILILRPNVYPPASFIGAYYAAQVGIGLKARDPASRDFLFALLGELERLKAQIGSNDAIDVESASSAYVENFALKVFAMADNEDRRGEATRYVSTLVTSCPGSSVALCFIT